VLRKVFAILKGKPFRAPHCKEQGQHHLKNDYFVALNSLCTSLNFQGGDPSAGTRRELETSRRIKQSTPIGWLLETGKRSNRHCYDVPFDLYTLIKAPLKDIIFIQNPKDSMSW
jgi:hypothetical protein